VLLLIAVGAAALWTYTDRQHSRVERARAAEVVAVERRAAEEERLRADAERHAAEAAQQQAELAAEKRDAEEAHQRAEAERREAEAAQQRR
jgi:colicin import membrane protein